MKLCFNNTILYLYKFFLNLVQTHWNFSGVENTGWLFVFNIQNIYCFSGWNTCCQRLKLSMPFEIYLKNIVLYMYECIPWMYRYSERPEVDIGSTRAMGCPYWMQKIHLNTGEEKQALLRVLTSEPSPN